MKHLLVAVCLLLTFLGYSQNSYSVASIAPEIKLGGSAVIRLNEKIITLHNHNTMTINEKRVVTVFDKSGLKALELYVGYDDYDSVKDYEAILYDSKGEETKKYKRRDFIDVSATGGSLYTDDRVIGLDFTPSFYPFTLEFSYEKKTSSTAQFPSFFPVSFYKVAVEKSTYLLINEQEIPMQIKASNLEGFDVISQESPHRIYYEASNLSPIRREYLSPSSREFLPSILLLPRKYSLKNETLQLVTWDDLAQFHREKLLKGRDQLPEQTLLKVAQLVANIDDPKEKARIIYEFMQNKTRYISVQIGIGGWQPFPAEDVDRLGYGDCKGLSNYTKALLESQGIEAYYTLVDSQEDGLDLYEDFVALQGDHIILALPFSDETVFLECTSQELPFNFLGTHTDNRKVLMVTPDGGVLADTHTYTEDDNLSSLSATVKLLENYTLEGSIKRESYGLKYGELYFLENETSDDQIMFYKEFWDYHNSISLSNVTYINDKTEVKFTEQLDFTSEAYVSKAGDRILLAPNLFTRLEHSPKKSKKRKLPLVIRRGYSYEDQIEIQLPLGYVVEAQFDAEELSNEFGDYQVSITPINDTTLLYKRKLVLKAGRFPKEKYNDYVDFIKRVVKKDKSKIVLNKTN